MSSKIARTIAALAVAGTPFIIATAPSASAAAGCTVNNAGTSTNTQVHISAPPPSVTVSSTSLSCSYVSEGGTAEFGCTLAAGTCEVYRNNVLIASCIAYANTNCGGPIPTEAGDVMRLDVYGGSGYVRDVAA